MSEEKHIARKVQEVLNARYEYRDGKFCFIRVKKLEIYLGSSLFIFKLDMEVSFKDLQLDGCAINKAKVYLLPEEVMAFGNILRKFPIPLPIAYRQYTYLNPHVVEITIESLEPPTDFARRLSAALEEIESSL